MNEQRDLFAARTRRDLGMARSGGRADRTSPGWTAQAAYLIRDYALAATGPFLIEDAIPFALAKGLAAPPDGRAWGAAAQRARRAGFIRSCGYAPAKSSNLSPKVQWVAA